MLLCLCLRCSCGDASSVPDALCWWKDGASRESRGPTHVCCGRDHWQDHQLSSIPRVARCLWCSRCCDLLDHCHCTQGRLSCPPCITSNEVRHGSHIPVLSDSHYDFHC